MSNVEKNEKIKQSLKATCEKRKSQVCTVYELKINERKLTSKQLTSLKMMFVEGKWFWNSIISFTENNNIKDFDIKEKTVKHFDKDHNDWKHEASTFKVDVVHKCPVCGKESTQPLFANGCCSIECHHIDFWRNALDDEAIIIDGHCYHVCEEPEDISNYNGFLGFSGQEFKIRKFDSDVIIITHNLWHQGEIPLEFNKQDNAQFVKV